MTTQRTAATLRSAGQALRALAFAAAAFSAAFAATEAAPPLTGTALLTMEGDLSARMVAGIDCFLDGELTRSVGDRAGFWQPDFSDRTAYDKSVAPNRERFRRMIGAVDHRVMQTELEYVATMTVPAKAAESDRFVAYAVRWPVFDGVHGEGLLLQPKGEVKARVVAIPDADQLPETLVGIAPGLPPELQYARRLAENGCQVIVPAVVDRTDRFSGNPQISRGVNQPHREWIYRQAYTLGRHVIGYEVQTVQAAVDWLTRQNQEVECPIGVAGWGEGGLLALYSAAIDPRIDAALVSGYFGPREQLWREPVYRNVFGLLREFGDAGLARLIVPRPLLVEHAEAPRVDGPPPTRDGRAGAAPGRIETPRFEDVRDEVERARELAGPFGSSIQLYPASGDAKGGPLAEAALLGFMRSLNTKVAGLAAVGPAPEELRKGVDSGERQQRLVRGMERHTQRLLQLATTTRDEFLWKKVPPTTPEAWREAMRPYREKYWNEVIGRFPASAIPLQPRSRLLKEAPEWTGYEVMVDVFPDVFAWGYLLVPKGIKAGERRPVVVTQHGLEGLPESVINEDPNSRMYAAYKAYAVRLVQRGFVVFAPHNPYRGGDLFRVLQRKANPLGKSLFGVIVAQHARVLDWLAAQPFVDPARIGFYGLSYGGNAAMVLPAILDERYALTINSGSFNDWIWKATSTDWRNTYMFTREYEKPDFNLGMTFGDAEIAALIAPRPFMVERGHDDGVGLDERVAFEYARVRRLYDRLQIPEKTEIEYFNGPHTIHGVGTFKFLHRHLQWPELGK